MTEDLFGPIWASWDVEQAVIGVYRTWLPEYLSEIERKRGLKQRTIPRPPAPESVHGGVDSQSWIQDTMPQVIVGVEPIGEPQRHGDGRNVQGYTVTVWGIWRGPGSELAEPAEDEARAVASYYGAASMLLIQQPHLGELPVEQLVMRTSPVVSFPSEEDKTTALVTTTFELWLSNIITEGMGPMQPLPSESPQWGGLEEPYKAEPEVKETKEPVKAVPVTEPV